MSIQAKYKTRKQQAGGDNFYRIYKDFHLYEKFYFPQLIQEPDPVTKKALVKRNEFTLIREEMIVMLFFMTLGMDLVMMSDKKRML